MNLVFVCGTPSGGTSSVAGLLHHLGVDMGKPMKSDRPYKTFEDQGAKCFTAEASPIQRFIMPTGGRDFRAYVLFRLSQAKGRRVGAKLGPAYYLGDPDPASLPLDIVKVDRPLEDAIYSDWKYQLMGGHCQGAEQRIRRACQMAGHWQAKESLCEVIRPVYQLDYYSLRSEPRLHVYGIAYALGLSPTPAQVEKATRFIR